MYRCTAQHTHLEICSTVDSHYDKHTRVNFDAFIGQEIIVGCLFGARAERQCTDREMAIVDKK